MDVILNEAEVRVLGALVEKQLTTPDYYPLTLNALTNACNQTSNRDPVVSYDETIILRALDGLRDKGLARVVHASDSRVPKYKHTLTLAFALTPQEVAVLCVLMLRGPQTAGEVRGRTGRLYEFTGLDEVETTLQGLAEKDPRPLVVRLPRQAGRKEARYAHLLSGEVKIDESAVAPRADSASQPTGGRGDRVALLEEEVATLRAQVADLQQQFLDFKKQFE